MVHHQASAIQPLQNYCPLLHWESAMRECNAATAFNNLVLDQARPSFDASRICSLVPFDIESRLLRFYATKVQPFKFKAGSKRQFFSFYKKLRTWYHCVCSCNGSTKSISPHRRTKWKSISIRQSVHKLFIQIEMIALNSILNLELIRSSSRYRKQ